MKLIQNETYEDAMLAYRAECDLVTRTDLRVIYTEGQPIRGWFARRAQRAAQAFEDSGEHFDLVAQLEASQADTNQSLN